MSRGADPPARDVAAEEGQGASQAEGMRTTEAVAPAHTDWLHHRLTLCAAPDVLAAFRAAARGAGIIPWSLDLDRLEEDWFLRLMAPATEPAQHLSRPHLIRPHLSRPHPSRSRLSAAGARVLAAQLREAVGRRHAIAVSAVGVSAACAFDLHALVPVPDEILHLGPDAVQAQAWLWAHWGTTAALRRVTEITPEKDRLAGETMAVSFWSADWTPWRALARLAELWPAIRFDVRPDYDVA